MVLSLEELQEAELEQAHPEDCWVQFCRMRSYKLGLQMLLKGNEGDSAVQSMPHSGRIEWSVAAAVAVVVAIRNYIVVGWHCANHSTQWYLKEEGAPLCYIAAAVENSMAAADMMAAAAADDDMMAADMMAAVDTELGSLQHIGHS